MAASLNDFAVGAPLLPGFRIRSGVFPAAFWLLIRRRFFAMFPYRDMLTDPSRILRVSRLWGCR